MVYLQTWGVDLRHPVCVRSDAPASADRGALSHIGGLGRYEGRVSPGPTFLSASSPAQLHPAAPPCAPTRPARGMSEFWIRQVFYSSLIASKIVLGSEIRKCTRNVCPLICQIVKPDIPRAGRGGAERDGTVRPSGTAPPTLWRIKETGCGLISGSTNKTNHR